MKVSLLTHTPLPPQVLTSFAGKICYNPELPELGQLLNVESQLFKPGHHSTLEHWTATFVIDDCPVADVDFGNHLVTPQYVTDQQSGRFCGTMYANPDYVAIEANLRSHYPEVSDETVARAMTYVREQLGLYNAYLAPTMDLVRQILPVERPHASKPSDSQVEKFAQEQLRMVIPLVMPTRFVYTINLITLAAEYKSAWNPGMKMLTQMMVDLILAEFPEISYMFQRGENQDWDPEFCWDPAAYLRLKPGYKLIRLDEFPTGDLLPSPDDKLPLDLLRVSPKFMDLATCSIKEEIEVSVAAYGQVQRSRSFRRAQPKFTGSLYVSPLMHELGLEQEMADTRIRWSSFAGKVPPSMLAALAPYGAMVQFAQEFDFCAGIHEGGQRLCWKAQEEFYHLKRAQREAIIEVSPEHPFLAICAPRCAGADRKCGEQQTCGRDIRAHARGEGYPERVV